jgi:hypothetical protein
VARVAPLLIASLLALGGCIHEKMEDAQPSIAAARAASAFDMTPLSVGPVTAAPVDAMFDRSIAIRGSTMTPPTGRFSTYLRDVLIAELRTAGRYDPASPLQVSAVLTENRVTEDFKRGGGVEAATFRLTRNGVTLFEQPIRAEVQWSSSFIGAVAIPAAFRTHAALSNTLVANLFANPGFRAAAMRK